MKRFAIVTGIFGVLLLSALKGMAAEKTGHVQDSTAQQVAPPESNDSGIHTAAWIVAGSGAILVGGSIPFLVLAHEKQAELGPNTDAATVHSESERYFRVGEVLLFSGIVGVLTGVSFELLAPKETTALHARIGFSTGQVLLTGTL